MSAFRRSSSLCSACAWEQCLRDSIITEGLVWSALCNCNALNLAGWLCWVWQLWKPHLRCWVYPFHHNGLIHLPLWRSLVWECHLPWLSGSSEWLEHSVINPNQSKMLPFYFFQSTHWAICIFGKAHRRWNALFQMFFPAYLKHFQNFHTTVNTV